MGVCAREYDTAVASGGTPCRRRATHRARLTHALQVEPHDPSHLRRDQLPVGRAHRCSAVVASPAGRPEQPVADHDLQDECGGDGTLGHQDHRAG